MGGHSLTDCKYMYSQVTADKMNEKRTEIQSSTDCSEN